VVSKAQYRIVSGEESGIYDEPHIEGRRITVSFIQARIEGRGLEPQTVADRYDLDVVDVHEALAYYHNHPAEMAEADRQRRETIQQHEGDDLLGPEDV
jgi:uncharacterized protein (DUF433 family)